MLSFLGLPIFLPLLRFVRFRDMVLRLPQSRSQMSATKEQSAALSDKAPVALFPTFLADPVSSEDSRMLLTVAALYIDTLYRIGVKHIFGLIGDSLSPIVEAIRTEGATPAAGSGERE